MASTTIASNFRRLLTFRGPHAYRGSNRSVATGAAAAAEAGGGMKTKAGNNLDMVGVFIPLGIVVTALTLGAYTAKGQLVHSPSVRVNKKRRGTVAEVDEPDHVADEGSRYVNRSFFRKVAHIQDFDAVRSGISDPTRSDNVFQR
ncbi:hypothetical protein KSP39_PZI011391 [Platanthera zijinensis]|uniref:Uncharacterized protein n=1 Tax=Platanthera zijinensis TaxID=2320716 RepID=A0AAP0BGV1_9ASPA